MKRSVKVKTKVRVPWNKNLNKEIDERIKKQGEEISRVLKIKYANGMKHPCGMKGHIPWNKNLTKETDTRLKISGEKRSGSKNHMFGKHPTAWNSGLTKETDIRVKIFGERRTGKNNPNFGNRHTDEFKRIQSERMSGDRNPLKNENTLRKWIQSCRIKPNKSEQKLNVIVQDIVPNEFKLNVEANIMIIGGKIPDFVNINGQKKLIELYGDFWHKGESFKPRVDFFKKFGWDTLIIWERELKCIETLKQKVISFTKNGGLDGNYGEMYAV